ncbi:MAG TPA: hypothetical protein VIH27_01335 [Nitrososphaerales archaeon]
MVNIDTTATLDEFRCFLINSTCLTFIPEGYLNDPEVFPEKEGETGSIYIEAADKVTLKKIRMVVFINAKDILGIIYTSKSGNTNLKWRQTRGIYGKVTGIASANSLVNLITAGVITNEYAEDLAKQDSSKKDNVPHIPEDFDDSTDQTVQDSDSKSQIPGLEGTLQTEDDI